ncbi:hypothetical protein AAOGI_06520 [Agarivorans albus]
MNQVDVSKDTVEQDWQRIETEYIAALKPVKTMKVDAPSLAANDDNYNQEGETPPPPPMTHEEKVLGLQRIFLFGLGSTIALTCRVDVSAEVDKASKDYAELLIHLYPNMPIVGLFERYQLHFAALQSTWTLGAAIFQKRAEKAQAKLDAEKAEQGEEKHAA